MNNTITQAKNEYWDKRKHDNHIEAICAAYVDKNFFDKLPTMTYQRLNGNNEETKKRQLNGEDVLLLKDGKVLNRIDEKAKVQGGMLNKVIGYPCFEILCKNKYLTGHFESWFVSPSNTTTHYALISIGSRKAVTPGHEYELQEGDITRMVYGLISRDRLHDWIEMQTGKSIKQITEDAWELLNNFEGKKFPQLFDTVKVYKSDGRGKYLYLKISDKKKELPVNLIVRRDYLRNCGLITELYVDKTQVRRYEPPELFEANEKLYKLD